jgi:surface antigen
MSDWLLQQSPGHLISMVAIVMGPLIAIVAIVSASWARVRRAETHVQIAEMEAALKQQMIERGMSADEIVRVLEAGQSSKGKKNKGVEEPVA